MYSYGPKTSGLPIPTGTQIATSRRPPSGLSDLTLVFTSAVPNNQVNKTSHENDTHKISRLRRVTYTNYLVLTFRRSEERRLGKQCVSTFRYRLLPYLKYKHNIQYN